VLHFLEKSQKFFQKRKSFLKRVKFFTIVHSFLRKHEVFSKSIKFKKSSQHFYIMYDIICNEHEKMCWFFQNLSKFLKKVEILIFNHCFSCLDNEVLSNNAKFMLCLCYNYVAIRFLIMYRPVRFDASYLMKNLRKQLRFGPPTTGSLSTYLFSDKWSRVTVHSQLSDSWVIPVAVGPS
jgi:hypothetical protein